MIHPTVSLIQKNAIALSEWKDARRNYDFEKAYIIDEIAKSSIAANLGLSKGDFLIDINGRPAAAIDTWEWTLNSASHTYIYYCPGKRQELHLQTNGIPIGCKLNKTSETIRKAYLDSKGDHEDLYVIWERYDWGALNDIMQHLFCSERKSSLLGKLLRFIPMGSEEPSELECLFRGISLYEAGDHEKGMEIIMHFATEHANHWQMNYYATVLYYRAKEILRLGDREEALSAFLDAYDYLPSRPIERAILKLGGEFVKSESPWLGKTFPENYRFPRYQQPGSVALADTIDEMKEGQILPVCLLASYRANGPYDDFMQKYIAFCNFFPKVFSVLHVITSFEGKSSSPWIEHEDYAREKGLAVEVLYDEEARLPELMGITCCPTVYFLNCRGEVLVVNSIHSGVDFWDAMTEFFKDNRG